MRDLFKYRQPEMKSTIIFTIILILLHFLTYHFARALIWQFNIRQPYWRKLCMAILFLITDGLLLVHALRLAKIFRFSANWLLLLWFVLMVSITIMIAAKLLRNIKRYRQHTDLLNRDLRLIAPMMLVGLFALALYNAYVPVVKHITIQIDKPLAQPVRIGLAADLHLGRLVGARQLDKLSDIMNANQVDIILLPGDIMDDDTSVYESEKMHTNLQKLRAPLGVYATLGNHDLFGNQEAITQAIEQAGIKVLSDDVLHIDNRFWLIGRPDPLDITRNPTVHLIQKANHQEPIFLLDHRPDEIEQHAQLPIDLQVSGHVHNGQIFPANFIVRALNRVSYGHEQINQTHFVVTSGFGFWGVPFRLASQAEVWIIDVHSSVKP